jgi:thiamine-phosphate pyrophosphorylase
MSGLHLTRPHLCLVTDPEKPDLIQKVERALAAGVTMLQLRGHTLSSARLYALALALRPLCQRYHALFIVNDRVDVGLATDADGFQLGGHSLPLTTARQLVGEHFLLGVSVHSPEEARIATVGGADFLLVGTIFPSPSHPGEAGSGPQLVSALKDMGLTLPLLAIGGITSANAQQVIQAGADGIAVLSAILDAADIEQAVRELRAAIALQTGG